MRPGNSSQISPPHITVELPPILPSHHAKGPPRSGHVQRQQLSSSVHDVSQMSHFTTYSTHSHVSFMQTSVQSSDAGLLNIAAMGASAASGGMPAACIPRLKIDLRRLRGRAGRVALTLGPDSAEHSLISALDAQMKAQAECLDWLCRAGSGAAYAGPGSGPLAAAQASQAWRQAKREAPRLARALQRYASETYQGLPISPASARGPLRPHEQAAMMMLVRSLTSTSASGLPTVLCANVDPDGNMPFLLSDSPKRPVLPQRHTKDYQDAPSASDVRSTHKRPQALSLDDESRRTPEILEPKSKFAMAAQSAAEPGHGQHSMPKETEEVKELLLSPAGHGASKERKPKTSSALEVQDQGQAVDGFPAACISPSHGLPIPRPLVQNGVPMATVTVVNEPSKRGLSAKQFEEFFKSFCGDVIYEADNETRPICLPTTLAEMCVQVRVAAKFFGAVPHDLGAGDNWHLTAAHVAAMADASESLRSMMELGLPVALTAGNKRLEEGAAVLVERSRNVRRSITTSAKLVFIGLTTEESPRAADQEQPTEVDGGEGLDVTWELGLVRAVMASELSVKFRSGRFESHIAAQRCLLAPTHLELAEKLGCRSAVARLSGFLTSPAAQGNTPKRATVTGVSFAVPGAVVRSRPALNRKITNKLSSTSLGAMLPSENSGGIRPGDPSTEKSLRSSWTRGMTSELEAEQIGVVGVNFAPLRLARAASKLNM